MTFNEQCVEAVAGNMKVRLSTGKMAKQASGAVVVQSGDTMVLVTVVGAKEAKPGQDFFPLTVNYTEKTYAGGKIPGSFFKREGRPSEDETLICRLIDRPIRPLFPEGYLCDTQVMATVISAEEDHDPAILSMIGASAALMISDIPFEGPIAGIKVGRVAGRLIANPSAEELKQSDMEIVVAAGKDAIFMVEGEAEFVSEEDLLEAIFFAKDAVQGILAAQIELAAKAGVAKREVPPPAVDQELKAKVAALATDRIAQAFKIKSKQERYATMAQIKADVLAELAEEFEGRDKEIKDFLGDLEYDRMRPMCWKPASVSMAATPPPSAPLPLKSVCCPAPMVLHSLPAAKPRCWLPPPWAPPRMSSAWTPSTVNTARSSCCITTSPPSRLARPVSAWHRAVARSVTACWPSGQFPPFCRIMRRFPTPSVLLPKHWRATVPPQWPRSAAAACR